MYRELMRKFPGFPREGINFIDWMPVMGSPAALDELVGDMLSMLPNKKFTKVAALETRGYLLGLPMARRLGAGFVPIRKKGKLPGPCFSKEYSLEYGTAAIEMQADAVAPDDSVLIVDDLLATGGTMQAANELVARVASDITDAFFIELTDIGGAGLLTRPYFSLIKMTER